MPESVFGTMQRGHHDDGTADGIVLTKIAAGQLVKVPFGSGTVASSGGLAYNIGSGSASAQVAMASNPDGSGTGVNFSVPSGLSQGARWTETLYGSVVGIRYRRNAATKFFNAVIDGVAYTMRDVNSRVDSVATTYADHEALWIIADDLDPTVPHTVQIVVSSDPYGATTNTVLAYGWLLEASRGYSAPPGWGTLPTPVALSTSTTATVSGSVYRKFFLHNTDAVTRKVTVKYATLIVKVVDIAAGQSAEIDLGVSVVGSSVFTLQCDAAAVVYWTPTLEARR